MPIFRETLVELAEIEPENRMAREDSTSYFEAQQLL